MADTIHFIITGGTLDSHYDGLHDSVSVNKESIVPEYIKSLQLHQNTEFTTVCMKDSRELTKDNLSDVLKAVEKSPSHKIIVTHGTYTMPDTARFLKANLKRSDQTIIFTGSMIPLSGFSPSDAPFNLGFALAEVKNLEAGIYVAMNGKSFDPDEVSKLLYQGRFDSLFSKNK